MGQEKNPYVMLGVTAVCLVILISISGCTSSQNMDKTSTQLSGTWVGDVALSMSGGRGNTSISQITFMSTIAEVTLMSVQGSFTMNYNYTVNGNTLVLEPTFTNRGGFPGQTPQNGTRPWNNTSQPPMNETWPFNGTGPGNGTRPWNWTRPENGTWNPSGGQRSLSISFSYRFNEEHTILYLNGAEFRKV
jgi:hypothetical protein